MNIKRNDSRVVGDVIKYTHVLLSHHLTKTFVYFRLYVTHCGAENKNLNLSVDIAQSTNDNVVISATTGASLAVMVIISVILIIIFRYRKLKSRAG